MLLGPSFIVLNIYGIKTNELLILQINCHAGKQDTFFSKQLWRNDFPFLEEQITCILQYLKSCGFGS